MRRRRPRPPPPPLLLLLSLVLALLCATCCSEEPDVTYRDSRSVSLTGLLMNTLFTFEDEACDQDLLHIRCPHGTTISIQFAQYGRQVAPSVMCPPLNVAPGVSMPAQDTSCLSPRSLQVVMDRCQDQRQCKLLADARTFGHDPCPGTSKYLEVAYKCRPNEFQSRITCEGEEMLLKCPKSKRLAVYSASFGSTNEGHVQCPTKVKTDYTKECHSKRALSQVMKLCFGRRNCNIRSDEQTFGRPCPPGVTKVLNVVYTCVPHRLLGRLVAPSYTASKGRVGDKMTTPSDHHDFSKKNRNREGELKEKVGVAVVGQVGSVPKHSTYDYNPALLTPTADSATYMQTTPDAHAAGNVTSWSGDADSDRGATPVNCVTQDPPLVGASEDEETVGFITDWIRTYKFLEENREKLILYVTVALLTGLTLLLLLVIAMLLHERRRSSRQAKLDVTDAVADTSHSTNASALHTPHCHSHDTSSNRDSLLDTSSERNDHIDLPHYNVRSLGRAPTLSRPAPHTLSRVHFDDPPSTFMSDPEHVRYPHEREVARSLYDLDNVRITRELEASRPTPSYSNFYR